MHRRLWRRDSIFREREMPFDYESHDCIVQKYRLSRPLIAEWMNFALFILFVCLVFYVPLGNFSLRWRRYHCRWTAFFLTYTRHSRQLSSEGSLACHTYCDTWHPFIMVISEDSWYSHLLPSVWQLSCHYLFLRLRSVTAGIRTPNLPHKRRMF